MKEKNTFENTVFIVDSEANQYLFNDKNLFSELNERVEFLNIIIANRYSLITELIENVSLKTNTPNNLIYNVTQQNGYYLPERERNII